VGYWKIAHKALQILALALFVASVFLPWFSETGRSPLAVVPPFGWSTEYWSWKSETRVFQGSELKRSYVTSFQEYWLGREYSPTASHVWFAIFILQLATVTAAAVGIIRDRITGLELPLYIAFSASSLTLTLAFYQMLLLREKDGFNSLRVNLNCGYALALAAFLIWLTLMLMHLASPSKERAC
jgi:hypothetical protein